MPGAEWMDKASVMDTLQELLDDLEACESFVTAKSGEFKSATAYKSLFPAATITVDYSPLTYDALAEQVLLPEAIICLVMDELGVSDEEAGDVLHDIIRTSRIANDAAPKTTSLPLPSPLLPPHALSPALAPADFEREPTPLSLISDSLCCDEELPFAPFNIMIAMGKKFFDLSWPDHMPNNPQHRRVPQIRITVDYCARRRFKRDHIPAVIFGGWPFEPNFSALFHRILDLGPTLHNLCMGLNQSHFFLGTIEYYGNKLTQSLKAQYASNRSSENGVRYYGECVHEILILETVTRLIQHDLGLGSDAIAVLKQSYTFGITLHPGDDGSTRPIKLPRPALAAAPMGKYSRKGNQTWPFDESSNLYNMEYCPDDSHFFFVGTHIPDAAPPASAFRRSCGKIFQKRQLLKLENSNIKACWAAEHMAVLHYVGRLPTLVYCVMRSSTQWPCCTTLEDSLPTLFAYGMLNRGPIPTMTKHIDPAGTLSQHIRDCGAHYVENNVAYLCMKKAKNLLDLESETSWRWVLNWSRSDKQSEAKKTNTYMDPLPKSVFALYTLASTSITKSLNMSENLVGKKCMEFADLSSDKEDYPDTRKRMVMLRLHEGDREGDESHEDTSRKILPLSVISSTHCDKRITKKHLDLRELSSDEQGNLTQTTQDVIGNNPVSCTTGKTYRYI
ncbi:hypothetical protein B0H17DRAFT_1143944 [Mycena rosella]|uniref:Uncharacterized protein n=1 Tax=Mycena rosella TaxID=1033263 RepID=A0AAD7CUI7_MYCRO|nr:hypothetical protein B0H17DRAFT_1143944 [Mycena rosella]